MKQPLHGEITPPSCLKMRLHLDEASWLREELFTGVNLTCCTSFYWYSS